jgi:hypothetical protein
LGLSHRYLGVASHWNLECGDEWWSTVRGMVSNNTIAGSIHYRTVR